jgi:hypothetical protein
MKYSILIAKRPWYNFFTKKMLPHVVFTTLLCTTSKEEILTILARIYAVPTMDPIFLEKAGYSANSKNTFILDDGFRMRLLIEEHG